MTTTSFTTSIIVDQPAAAVFNAINNVRGWWSESIEGETDQLNAIFDYHYQDVHRCRMKIIEMVPNKKIAWQVLDNYFSFTKDQNEWKGNTILFQIVEQDDKTVLHFTQEGLVPEYECYDVCQNAWRTYIQKSLYSLITTGKGQPNSKDKPQTADEERLGHGNFTTTFFVDQSPEEVFNAVNNVGAWWQGTVEGKSDAVGDVFTYRMKDVHYSKQRIDELVPNKKVLWTVTDSQLNFLQKKDEWTGTKMIFDIDRINNKTQLRFTHAGLTANIECYDACSNAWTRLIQESLQSLIKTGKGIAIF